MRRRVRFACGDRCMVHLVGTPRACQETLQLLRHSLCPGCQRHDQEKAARQCAARVGLRPLRATSSQQLGLAEVTRASLWNLLLPPGADEQAHQLLAALFNRQLQATFWTPYRVWAMYRLDSEQAGEVLFRLLHAERKEV